MTSLPVFSQDITAAKTKVILGHVFTGTLSVDLKHEITKTICVSNGEEIKTW